EQHDTFHHVVVVDKVSVRAMDGLADLSQSNLRPLRDYSNVADVKRGPVPGRDDSPLDVGHVPEEAHFPHVDLLETSLEKAAACVDIFVRELLLHLSDA